MLEHNSPPYSRCTASMVYTQLHTCMARTATCRTASKRFQTPLNPVFAPSLLLWDAGDRVLRCSAERELYAGSLWKLTVSAMWEPNWSAARDLRNATFRVSILSRNDITCASLCAARSSHASSGSSHLGIDLQRASARNRAAKASVTLPRSVPGTAGRNIWYNELQHFNLDVEMWSIIYKLMAQRPSYPWLSGLKFNRNFYTTGSSAGILMAYSWFRLISNGSTAYIIMDQRPHTMPKHYCKPTN